MANGEKVRRQRPVRGGRRAPMATAVIAPLEKAIAREQRRWNVTRSFVIATAAAAALDVIAQEDYHEGRTRRRRKQ